MVFKWGGSFVSSKLEFINQKIECVKFSRDSRTKVSPIKSDCFNNVDINFGYFSIYAKVSLVIGE